MGGFSRRLLRFPACGDHSLAVAEDLLVSRPDALERAHWTLLPACRARPRVSGSVRADDTTNSPLGSLPPTPAVNVPGEAVTDREHDTDRAGSSLLHGIGMPSDAVSSDRALVVPERSGGGAGSRVATNEGPPSGVALRRGGRRLAAPADGTLRANDAGAESVGLSGERCSPDVRPTAAWRASLPGPEGRGDGRAGSHSTIGPTARSACGPCTAGQWADTRQHERG